MRAAILAVLVALCLASFACAQQRGVEIRLTRKGLGYTIQEAVKLLHKDLNGKKFKNFNGNNDGIKFSVSNLLIRSINIGGSSLTPSYSGLTASVSRISTNIYGRLHYEKRVWGFKISDTVTLNARASDVSFTLSLKIGRRSDGRPTIGVNSCQAHVGGLRIRFSGSKVSWLYNLFSSMVERKIKGQLSDIMCKTARESIQKRGSSELAEFPVKKAIDKWAMVDYSLTTAPKSTHNYMDIFIKGEFVPRNNPSSHSSLVLPTFSTSSDNNKMLYFWITDYTLNTAAEVYHKLGSFNKVITKNSRDLSPTLRFLLTTNRFRFIVPELARRFPNRPLQIKLHSYKAPIILIEGGKIYMFIYAAATFSVEMKNGKLYDVFSINMDVKADGSVSVSDKNIKGNLQEFSINLKTTKSGIGPVNIPVNQPFIKNIIKAAVMDSANRALKKGFPLPNLKEVTLKNPEIKFMKGVIRIGVDCVFQR